MRKYAFAIYLTFNFYLSFGQSCGVDSLFGEQGFARSQFDFSQNFMTQFELQSDHKIVVAGTAYSYDSISHYYIFCCRYNEDGSLDGDFGLNGFFQYEFPNCVTTCNTMALDTSGKILLGGYFADTIGTKIFVARLFENGMTDSSFGNSGMMITNFGVSSICSFINVLNDNSFLLSGTYVDSAFQYLLVAKYSASGELDSSFNQVGYQSFFGDFNSINKMVVQADNKIVANIIYYTPWNEQAVQLFRLNQDGTIDSSFADNGFYSNVVALYGNEGGVSPRASDIVLDSAQRIVAIGNFSSSEQNSTYNPYLIRLLSSGQLDCSFGDNGAVRYTSIADEDYPTTVYKLVILPTTEIMFGGFIQYTAPYTGFHLVRIFENGMLNSAYCNSGELHFNIDNSQCPIAGIKYDSSAGLLVGGHIIDSTGIDLLLFRFNSLSVGVPVLAADNSSLNCYPNPLQAGDQIHLTGLPPGNIWYTLSSLSGNKLLTGYLNSQSGVSRTINLPPGIKEGIYFLRFINPSFLAVERIVVINR